VWFTIWSIQALREIDNQWITKSQASVHVCMLDSFNKLIFFWFVSYLVMAYLTYSIVFHIFTTFCMYILANKLSSNSENLAFCPLWREMCPKSFPHLYVSCVCTTKNVWAWAVIAFSSCFCDVNTLGVGVWVYHALESRIVMLLLRHNCKREVFHSRKLG